MQITKVKVSDLLLDPSNARQHSTKNLDAIKASLKKFAQVEPLVVRKADNVVIGGNGRLTALRELGIKEVDVHYLDVDNTTAKALAIALNRTAETATWNLDELGDQLQALREDDWDLGDLGFELDDLPSFGLEDEISGNEGLTDPDEVPETQQNEFGVERGQIWKLGEHRLMCGDSTSKDDVGRLMNGEKANMVFTDPPYGMNLDTDYTSLKKKGYHSKQDSGNRYDEIIGDSEPFTAKPILEIFDYCKEIFLFGADYYLETIERDHENLGSWIVWDKRTTKEGSTTLDKQFGSCFELCWCKQKHKREIARILHAGCFSVENDKRQHPSQKPVDLPKWFIDKYAVENGNVADLFLGSGSTLIACEKTGRKCYGMEIDPHYCSVIIKRYQDFTGNKAELIHG